MPTALPASPRSRPPLFFLPHGSRPLPAGRGRLVRRWEAAASAAAGAVVERGTSSTPSDAPALRLHDDDGVKDKPDRKADVFADLGSPSASVTKPSVLIGPAAVRAAASPAYASEWSLAKYIADLELGYPNDENLRILCHVRSMIVSQPTDKQVVESGSMAGDGADGKITS